MSTTEHNRTRRTAPQPLTGPIMALAVLWAVGLACAVSLVSAACAPSDNREDCEALQAFGISLGWQKWVTSSDGWMGSGSVCSCMVSSPTAKVGADVCALEVQSTGVVCLACCVPQVLVVQCLYKSPTMLTSVLIQVTSWGTNSGCEAGCSTL